MARHAPWFILWLVAATTAAAQAPPPIASDFSVQSDPTLDGQGPQVAASAGGGFFVVWQGDEVLGRRFTALGTPLGDEFVVNSTTAGSQGLTGIDMNPNGAAVVVFTSSEVWPGEVRFRRFDAFGNPLGNDQVVTSVEDGSFDATVGMADSGAFVIAFRKTVDELQETDILVRRFAADGDALGPASVINTYTDDQQWTVAVAMAPNGAFVATWGSTGSPGDDDDGRSVQARCFAADGTPIGDQFQVNTTIADDQGRPDVAVADSGAFVIVWESETSSGSDIYNSSVQMQRYSAACMPVGGEIQVNTYPYDWQGEPAVAMSPNGAFTVVWHSDGSPGTDDDATSVQARTFTADGQPMSDQYQVNSTEDGHQRMADVAGNPAARSVIVWDHYPEAFDWTVRGRLYGYPTIFIDDFESGNTSWWSTTVR